MNGACRHRWGLFFLLAAAAIAGCAHRTPYPVEGLQGKVPSFTELTEVPFFPQEDFQCGPAALVTVLNETGLAVSPGPVAEEIFTPAKQGSFQAMMVGAARHHGRMPYVIDGFEALLLEVAAGNPVVVLQNLGLNWAPRWHYAVVVGYDLQKQTLILRSGTTQRKIMNWLLFDRTWQRGNRWGMVVVPPGKLPASAGEKPYLMAVFDLEQTGRTREAAAAYAAALERWPSSLGAAMGLGNSLFTEGRLEEAEDAFRTAAKIAPKNGDAYNNLALVLARQKRFDEAVDAALEAVRLGGENRPIYFETLEEIRKLKAEHS